MLKKNWITHFIDAASGREGTGFIPTNDNGSDKPGFKLLSKEDLAREQKEEEEEEEDYYYDDAVVIISADDEEPRLLDIPRDTSDNNEPFFKLPLPDEGQAEQDEYYDDVVVVSVGNDDEEVKL